MNPFEILTIMLGFLGLIIQLLLVIIDKKTKK